jgi:hypothetical protein
LRKIINASKANVIVDGNAFSGVKEKNYAKEVYKDIMNWTRPDHNGDDWRWEKALDFIDGYSKSYGSNWDADDVFLNDEASFIEWLISLGDGISLIRNFENELEKYLETPDTKATYPSVFKFTRQTSKKKVYSSKKTKTSFEQAAIDYKQVFGVTPNDRELTNLYYEYGKNWKQYDSFTDWLNYNVE